MENTINKMGRGGGGLIQRRTMSLSTITTLGVGVCFGSIIGGSFVWYFFIRRKLASIFAFQRSIQLEVEGLRTEIRQLKSSSQLNYSKSKSQREQSAPGLKSALKLKEKRTVKFANGYDTADEDDFVTASSSDISGSEDDSEYFEDHNKYANLTGLARRVPGSEK
jgi:hypothetical protein